MKYYSVNDLKVFKDFRDNIRWEVTPKIFIQPTSVKKETGSTVEIDISGYMLYVDMVRDKPTIVIMKNGPSMSLTVGYIEAVPKDLLDEALKCSSEECIDGMYPLTDELKDWLKKELGISC